ncbi:MAG: ATP-binding protein [Acidimicrobiales bacterium]
MERQVLLDEFEASFTGLSQRSAFLIEGYPGLGKTALINSACRLAERVGIDVLCARASPLESGARFGVARQLFEAARAQFQVEIPAPLLNGCVTPALSSPPQGVAVGDGWFIDVLAELGTSLSGLAATKGLLIAIDDLQWCDAESMMWLEYLSRRLEHRPLWLMAATLPRRVGRDSAAGMVNGLGTRTLTLKPLNASSVSALIRQRADYPQIDLDFEKECIEATRGNPLLLFSLLEGLNLSDTARTTLEERIRRASPANILRSLMSRLRSLPPEAHAVLQAVAVLGDFATTLDTATLAGIDTGTLSDIIDPLSDLGIVERELPFRFIYPIERSVVYQELSLTRRASIHLEAARVLAGQNLSPDVVAEHLLLTEPHGDAWVTERLMAGAREAQSGGEGARATRYLKRALDEPPDVTTRPQVLLALASSDRDAGSAAALRLLGEAAEMSADPTIVAETALGMLGGIGCGPQDEMVTLLCTVSERLGDAHPELRARVALARAALDQSLQGVMPNKDGLQAILGTVESTKTRSTRLGLGHLSFLLALTAEGSDASHIGELASSTLDDDIALGDLVEVRGATNAISALIYVGRLREAVRHARSLQGLSRKAGIDWAFAEFSTVMSAALSLQGDLSGAELHAQRALATMRERDWTFAGRALGLLGLALMEQGRTAEATIALDTHERTRTPTSLPELFAAEQKGMVQLAEGDARAAHETLMEVGKVADGWQVTNPAVTGWRAGAARAALLIGETRLAHELATENMALAREFGAPISVGRALRVVALVVDPTDRLALLDEAVNLLESTGALLELAKATVELGTSLRNVGRQEAARSTLREGTDLALKCGAHPLVDRAVRELRASGARPRRLALSGVEALTPSERRVAELAAEGNKNARIAELLYVSEKTVEGHLSRTYQKLGISSRDQLHTMFTAMRPRGTGELSTNSAS